MMIYYELYDYIPARKNDWILILSNACQLTWISFTVKLSRILAYLYFGIATSIGKNTLSVFIPIGSRWQMCNIMAHTRGVQKVRLKTEKM